MESKGDTMSERMMAYDGEGHEVGSLTLDEARSMYRDVIVATEGEDGPLARPVLEVGEMLPEYAAERAEIHAENAAAKARREAAAILGRKGGQTVGRGTGEAKRRGDADHYRALQAKRRPKTVRVVRGLGAAAGLWVVEHLLDGQWRQAALPVKTKRDALDLASVVREHGAILGR
jgi:hypothetical protein